MVVSLSSFYHMGADCADVMIYRCVQALVCVKNLIMLPAVTPIKVVQGDETNSEELLSFLAGKMLRDPSTNKVTADNRKGVCTFSRVIALDQELSMEYFILKWYEKENLEVENSYIVFPRAHELRALNSGVYGLYRRIPAQHDLSNSNEAVLPLCIFWLQESKEQFDSKLSAINSHLRSGETCVDTISEHESTVLHSLLNKKISPNAEISRKRKFPSIRSLFQDPKTIQLLKEKAEFYCRAVENTIPSELRRDMSGLNKSDMCSTLHMYVGNKEMRECEDLLQECIDSNWSPRALLDELCIKDKAKPSSELEETSFHNFVDNPSTLSLMKLLVASKTSDENVNDSIDSKKCE
ncbi:hypothetical protein XU18_3389 [Perkinsela sp. CCAP 1560/4]|nr:hypothetical protein XU18_3389 [Perkinsela sp. CCAP 1560/4]|eukprot:KNH05618.1 hypothetical protein XU18_3389 [Perkinsela sp. CCAP 1560/4]